MSRGPASRLPTTVLGLIPVFGLLCLLSAVVLPATAHAGDGLFAMQDDAELNTSIELLATTVLPSGTTPDVVHGFGGRLRGGLRYVDDDKMALFEVADVTFHMVYRQERERYDAGSLPSMDFFSLSSQYRLQRDTHLLYGAALLTSGAFAHAATGGLAYRLGIALPIIGRDAATMRQYRRMYLQVETLPLVGSLLADLQEEGFHDQERLSSQIGAEVALTGRLETAVGVFSGEARLSASYVHQQSMYLLFGFRWVGQTFWRRFAGVLQTQVLLPLRPRRSQLSEEAQALLYDHHFNLSFGMLIYLGDAPSVTPRNTREQRRVRRQRRQQERRRRWNARRVEREADEADEIEEAAGTAE